MLQQAAQFLLDVIVQPFAVILLLRFHMQWLRAPMRNQFGEFIMSLTNFAVLRTRRFIPAFKGYDTSTLLLAYLVETVYMYLSEFVWIYQIPGNHLLLSLLAIGIVKLISLSLTMLMVAVIIQAVLSWFRPNTIFEPILNVITYPFIKPIQQRIPPAGGVDLSSFVLIVVIQLLQMLPVYYLDRLVRSFI
jgi:YggT family protein